VFASGGEHRGQGTEEFAATVPCAGRNDLAEPVFAQPAESQSVHKAGEDLDPGVGDERLAGERDRKGRENTAKIRHRKGAPSLGRITVSTTTIFPPQSTLLLFKHASRNAAS
jgi:hypothetical protein